MAAMAEDGHEGAQARLDRIPQLNGFGSYFVRHFADLTTERSYGPSGRPLPIPNSKVRQLARHHGLDYNETEEMVEMIRAIDEVYLNTRK